MYSKTLLSNVTLGQNNFDLFRLKCNTYRFYRIEYNVILILKLKHTSKICSRPIALGVKRQISSAFIT